MVGPGAGEPTDTPGAGAYDANNPWGNFWIWKLNSQNLKFKYGCDPKIQIFKI